jgi:hypothetical protein
VKQVIKRVAGQI